MKKIYLIIFMLACFHLAKATNPVPNPSFENWTSGNPDNWTTSNYAGVDTNITQVTPGHSGSYAVKGQTFTDGFGDTIPPVLEALGSGVGFTVTQNYNNLELYYKSNLVSGDIITVIIGILNAGQTTIAGAIDTIHTNASGFTQLEVPFSYFTSDSASTAVIQITISSASGGSPHPASYFIIDDISLTGDESTGVQEITANNKLQIYPVPAHDFLTVKGQTENNKPMQFVLLDEAGRVVMEKKSETPSGNFIDTEFNLQGIAPGFYSLMMITDEKILNQRIVVQ